MTSRRRRPGDSLTEPDRARHIPVLLSEVLANLQPTSGETYIDGTFGAGGYTRGLLDAGAATVVAIDRDPSTFRMAASWAGGSSFGFWKSRRPKRRSA